MPKKEVKNKYFEAVGRRKTSVARVRVFQGQSGILANEKDYKKYFSLKVLQKMVEAPLDKAEFVGKKIKISARVSGGGINSQAEAVRHGIARALVLMNPDNKPALKAAGFLKRDPRMVERKKYGLKKARKAPQWAKR